MNKHEIIEQLAKDKIVEGIIDNINNKDPDLEDLKQGKQIIKLVISNKKHMISHMFDCYLI